MSPRTVAIVQARMGSSRLPRKVLEKIGEQTMLERVLKRVASADRVDAVVVATTTNPMDDVIAAASLNGGWLLTRGSENDVLDRYRQAANEHEADVILRVCSDCPMTSPTVIDSVIAAVVDGDDVDYAANNFPPASYPKGLDVEAFNRVSLERAWSEDERPEWREHVTPYIRENASRFKQAHLRYERDLSTLRWTVDTPEDLQLIRLLVDQCPPDASWEQIAAIQAAHPEWTAINRDIQQRQIQR